MRLLVTVVLGMTALAGDSERDWNNLQQLRTGEKIEVVDARMNSNRGTFARADDAGVSLVTKSGEMALKRDEVARVSVSQSSRRLRKILLGAAIGGGAMLVASAAANVRFANEGHDGYLYPILVPAGVGVGAAIGATGSSYRTVYRARNLKAR